MRRHFMASAFAIGAALLASSVRANAVVFSDALPLAPTNSTRNLELQKFDPSLGTLQSIELMLTGHVEGVARFESRDAMPRLITMDFAAHLELRGPDSTTLGMIAPMVSISRNATAYDGVLDFGGTSGETINGLSATAELPILNLPVDVYGAMFTGLDRVALPVIATGQSTGSGGGNVIFHFSTLTSAEASVTYTYTPVPEPVSLAMLALCAIALRRRGR